MLLETVNHCFSKSLRQEGSCCPESCPRTPSTLQGQTKCIKEGGHYNLHQLYCRSEPVTMPPKTSGKAAKKSGVNQVFSAQHRLCRKVDGTFPYSVSYPVSVTEFKSVILTMGTSGTFVLKRSLP